MKKYYAVLFCFMIYQNAACQDSYFTVLATSQDVVSINPRNKQSTVKTGDKLGIEDKLILNQKSYICFVNPKGQSLELKKEGKYSLKELHKKLENSGSGVVSRYLDVVKSELLKNKSRKDDYGAVVREKKNNIPVTFPLFTSLPGSEHTFSWNKYTDSSIYVFKLISPSNTPVLIKRTSDTNVRLDFNEIKLTRDTCYKINIKLLENDLVSSDTACIVLPSEKVLYSLDKELKELNQYVDRDTEALNEILVGRIYEKYNMNYEALDHYKKSLELSHNSREFRNLVITFLQSCNWNYNLQEENK